MFGLALLIPGFRPQRGRFSISRQKLENKPNFLIGTWDFSDVEILPLKNLTLSKGDILKESVLDSISCFCMQEVLMEGPRHQHEPFDNDF